ncbi:hypothetical protein DESA109040_02305 [Deinococcus saxicola]
MTRRLANSSVVIVQLPSPDSRTLSQEELDQMRAHARQATGESRGLHIVDESSFAVAGLQLPPEDCAQPHQRRGDTPAPGSARVGVNKRTHS